MARVGSVKHRGYKVAVKGSYDDPSKGEGGYVRGCRLRRQLPIMGKTGGWLLYKEAEGLREDEYEGRITI
jgi:hypothetical protein